MNSGMIQSRPQTLSPGGGTTSSGWKGLGTILGMTLVGSWKQTPGGGEKRFWSWLRSLGGSYRGRDEVFRRVKDKDGMIIGEGELVVDRWKRYFTAGAREELERSQVVESLGEGLEEIELEEMVRELQNMKSGRSPGVCNIEVELLQAGGKSLVKWMQRVFNMVMESGTAPRDWQGAVVIPVYKKRCRLKCSNTEE